MKFSLAIPRPTHDVSTGDLERIGITAQLADEHGVEAISTSDHPFPLVVPGKAGHRGFDPFVLLSFLAGRTTRTRVHFSLIVNGYRNPFLTASMLAALDQLSGGRLIAGFGAGYLKEEFDALGGTYAGRGRIVEESVAAMRAAWSGQPVHATGDGWVAAGNTMLRPATGPHPRLWLGGNGDIAMERAARLFDGWMPFEAGEKRSKLTGTGVMTLDVLDARVDRFRALAQEMGRPEPEVCLVRTRTDWLSDPGIVVEDLQRLEQSGVDWLQFNLPQAGSVADELADFLAAVDRSGVHRA